MNVPGFANCHSHAFHRALRGRDVGGNDFWQWRDRMYALVAVLNAERYHRLARGVFAEMRLAGYTSVGEFHYLHRPDLAEAVIEAARAVGLRICLLTTFYERAGFAGEPLHPMQERFVLPLDLWQARASDLAARYAAADDVVIGTAIHSVRAVRPEHLAEAAATLGRAPLHVHVSEQPAENAACLAATGRTPVQLLAEAGVWGPRTTAVHATHLTDDDVAVLGSAGGFACFCPTTEAELADGIGPSVALRTAGARITLGSDSNTVIDPFAEARALAMHERLRTGRRDGWRSPQLWQAASSDGHESLGFADPGSVDVRLSARTAGANDLIWAATAADVAALPDLDPGAVAAELDASIAALWSLT